MNRYLPYALAEGLLAPLCLLVLLVFIWREVRLRHRVERAKPLHHRCSDEIWNNRVARTRLMFNMNAPDLILWQEADLIVCGWHGGRWKAAIAMLRNAIRRDLDWFIVCPFLRTLCRMNLYHHSLMADGACDFCYKGWPAEDVISESDLAAVCDCIGED